MLPGGVETGVFNGLDLRRISTNGERSSAISEKLSRGCHFMGAVSCADGGYRLGFRRRSVLRVHQHLHVGQFFKTLFLCALVFAL